MSDPADGEIQQALIARGNLPRHIAITMDGNGRWAARRGLDRIEGHRAAVESVRDVVRVCGELGIEVLTLFAFSTENWARPRREVMGLMRLLQECLDNEVDELDENNVRLMSIGRRGPLFRQIRSTLSRAIERTAHNNGLILNLALSYGSRREIVDAVRQIAVEVAQKQYSSKRIDEKLLAQHLYTAGLPDPDLLIRTSGEFRLSNFLLWQLAYTEIWFTDVLWPDFRRTDLYQAIRSYQSRERRFGKTSAQLSALQTEDQSAYGR